MLVRIVFHDFHSIWAVYTNVSWSWFSNFEIPTCTIVKPTFLRMGNHLKNSYIDYPHVLSELLFPWISLHLGCLYNCFWSWFSNFKIPSFTIVKPTFLRITFKNNYIDSPNACLIYFSHGFHSIWAVYIIVFEGDFHSQKSRFYDSETWYCEVRKSWSKIVV